MARTSTPRARKPASAQAFTRKLLAWWARAARDLPWRRTRDPYRVLVSEFMLQQTQVARVAEYYPRFLERFPDLGTLACAPARAVREAWEGLGYYARARNLHSLAKDLARRHDATLPSEPDELIKLPGVGPYTAGAVASFAYEKPVPAVDTNVARVIRRVFFGGEGRGKRFAMAKRKPAERRNVPPPSPLSPSSSDIWALASALVPKNGKRAWKFNQAIMELGALVCVARKPKCPECPVKPNCKTGRRAQLGRETGDGRRER
jgi:A/G-specific adenine glycosylase